MRTISRLFAFALLLLLSACGADRGVPEPALAQTSSSKASSMRPVPADYHVVVQEIYVAYFGRPADPDGQAFFAQQYFAAAAPTSLEGIARDYSSNAGIRALIDSFGTSRESQDLYGGDTTVFLTAIYRNLFSRAPDAAGLAYWTKAIDSGAVTRASAAVSIMSGSQGSDLDIIGKKNAFATLFTSGLSTQAQRDAYSGLAANAIVREEMSKIVLTTPLEEIPLVLERTRAALGIASGGGTTSAQIATVTLGTVPGNEQGILSILEPVATNRGLYFKVLHPDDSGSVFKLHGLPGFVNSWTSAKFPSVSAFAVSNPYSEPERGFAFYWHGWSGASPPVRRYGFYVANSNLPGYEWEDDIAISAIAAGGVNGTLTPQPWVIANGFSNINSDMQYVFQQDPGANSLSKTSGLFRIKAEEAYRGLGGNKMLSHPENPELYVADGDVLHVYSSSALKKSIAFPSSLFGIQTLLWAENALWIGHADGVYRMGDNYQPVKFTQLQSFNPASQALGGSFCIQNGEIMTSDGMAMNTTFKTIRSWLSTGTLSPTQQVEAGMLRAYLAPGIYCSDRSIRIVYAVRFDGKIMAINPVP